MDVVMIYVSLVLPFLPMITSSHLDIDPPNDVYILAEKSFNITCTSSYENQTITPSLLQVQICHHGYTNQKCHEVDSPLTNVSNKTVSRIYRVNHAQQTDTAWYRCQYGNYSILPIRITVFEVPILPDNITCISHDLFNLTCKWKEKPSKYANTTYLSYYRYGGYITIRNCPHKLPMGCYWPGPNSGNDDTNFDYTENVIDVILEAKNDLISINKTYSFHIPNIVQLSKMSLVIENVTEHNITVSWKLPYWYSTHSLNKKINTRVLMISKWNPTPQEIQVSYSDLSNGPDYLLTFRNLIPFTNYTIQMQSSPLSSKYWSEKSMLTAVTAPAVPSAVPDISLSAYFTCTKEASYQVTGAYLCILLKKIPDIDVNSYFTNYSIKLTIQDLTFSVNVDHNEVSVPVANQIPPSTFTLDIFSYNDVGRSKKNSSLVIQTLKGLKPRLVMVNIDSVGNYDVSWIVDEMVTSSVHTVNVYWCKESNNNGICVRDVGWNTYPGNITTAHHVLHDKRKIDWLFAVGFVNELGQSGGLTFAGKDCVFSQTNLDPQNVPGFTVIGVQNETTTLMLTFRFKFCDFHDRPTGYNIYYLKNLSEDEKYNCSTVKKLGKSESVTSSLDVLEYHYIENLLPKTTYTVCMDVQLANNTTKESVVKTAKTFYEVTGRHSSSNASKTVQVIAGVFSAIIAVILVIIIFVILKRKCYDNEDVSVTVPDIKQAYAKVPLEIGVIECNDVFSDKDDTIFQKQHPYDEIKDDSGNGSSLHSKTSSDDSSPCTPQPNDTEKQLTEMEAFSKPTSPSSDISLQKMLVRTTDRQSSDEGFEDGHSSNLSSKYNISSSCPPSLKSNCVKYKEIPGTISAVEKTSSVPFLHVEDESQQNSCPISENDYSSDTEDGYRTVNVRSDSSSDSSSCEDDTSSLNTPKCSVTECSNEHIDSYTKCDQASSVYLPLNSL